MYYVYLWRDANGCRPLISRAPLCCDEIPADVSVRIVHCAAQDHEALDVFRALLEYIPDAGLWSSQGQDAMTRTISWDVAPTFPEPSPAVPGWGARLLSWLT